MGLKRLASKLRALSGKDSGKLEVKAYSKVPVEVDHSMDLRDIFGTALIDGSDSEGYKVYLNRGEDFYYRHHLHFLGRSDERDTLFYLYATHQFLNSACDPESAGHLFIGRARVLRDTTIGVSGGLESLEGPYVIKFHPFDNEGKIDYQKENKLTIPFDVTKPAIVTDSNGDKKIEQIYNDLRRF